MSTWQTFAAIVPADEGGGDGFWSLILALPFLLLSFGLKYLRNHVRVRSELDLNVWHAHISRAGAWIIPAFLCGRCSVHPDANTGGIWDFMTGALILTWAFLVFVGCTISTEADAEPVPHEFITARDRERARRSEKPPTVDDADL